MTSYGVFLLIAALTVLSPGPGVLLTLSNSLRDGITGALSGIAGIVLGTLVVAFVSASSLGLLLAKSALAFSIMKWVGAAYLIYLGVNKWRMGAKSFVFSKPKEEGKRGHFLEGFLIQVTNPKAVFFFMAIFPQFVNYSKGFAIQFSALVLSYSALVLFIHFGYAHLARFAKRSLNSAQGQKYINRVSGAIFISFGIGLANANR